MSTYPSSVIAFPTRVNGQVIDASHVNSPDDEITAIQSFVGTSSSTFGMTYDLRSPSSNGGGHIQSANKGGTGQVSFTKGDILAASNSSTLSRVAAGSDGQVVGYDSTQTSGIKPVGVATAAQIQNQTYTYARASVMSASVYGINLSQAVSVLSDGQAFAIKWPTTNTTSVLALSVNATGPSSVAARIKNPDGTNVAVGAIKASAIGIVEFDSVSSVFQLANTPDAEGLVGTLPALDGSALTNLNGSNISGVSRFIATQSSTLTLSGSSTETGIISDTSLSGGSLSAGRAIIVSCFVNITEQNTSGDTTFRLYYGGGVISTISHLGTSGAQIGRVDFHVNYTGANSQYVNALINTITTATSGTNGVRADVQSQTSSIASGSNQNIKLTVQGSAANTPTTINVYGAVARLI